LKEKPQTVDKDGFSDSFFVDLQKEYDRINSFAQKQKELKKKHTKAVMQQES
jgi:hypothetical protein